MGIDRLPRILFYNLIFIFYVQKNILNFRLNLFYLPFFLSFFFPLSFCSHMGVHGDARPHQCLVCNFASRFRSHLVRHMRIHTGSKPYRCPYCSYECNMLVSTSTLYIYNYYKNVNLIICLVHSFKMN